MKVLLHAIEQFEWTHHGFRELLGERNVDSFIPKELRNTRYIADKTNYSNENYIEDLDKYDLIVFRSWFSFVDSNFKNVLDHSTSAPKIVLDYEDSYLIHNVCRSKQIALYFKRELVRQKVNFWDAMRWLPAQFAKTTYLSPMFFHKNPFDMINLTPKVYTKKSKLRPYPVTTIPDERYTHAQDKNRDIDLSLIMTLSHGERKKVFSGAQKMAAVHKGKRFILKKSGLTKDEYLKVLTKSKVSISVRGMGYDSFRYWEVPCYGAALLSKRTPMAIPNDFVEGKSALFFDKYEELDAKFNRYVVESDEWKEIARAGQENFFKYHTPKKRIKNTILREIEELSRK
ncbi:MAG: glycosyltransferase [Candidatus Micrarchaeales archaeon]|nr:glycosyltransferase [Candidatus Micrarchaeales archaeon]